MRGIHRSSVNSPHKGQWRGALMFTLICARINGWVNNREAGDLRRYRAHYDVIVMVKSFSVLCLSSCICRVINRLILLQMDLCWHGKNHHFSHLIGFNGSHKTISDLCWNHFQRTICTISYVYIYISKLKMNHKSAFRKNPICLSFAKSYFSYLMYRWKEMSCPHPGEKSVFPYLSTRETAVAIGAYW